MAFPSFCIGDGLELKWSTIAPWNWRFFLLLSVKGWNWWQISIHWEARGYPAPSSCFCVGRWRGGLLLSSGLRCNLVLWAARRLFGWSCRGDSSARACSIFSDYCCISLFLCNVIRVYRTHSSSTASFMEIFINILCLNTTNINLELHIKTRIHFRVNRILFFVCNYSISCGTFAHFNFTTISLEQI